MLRDKIKNKKYFEEYVDFEQIRLEKRKKLITQVIENRGVDDAVRKALLSILNYRINLVNSEYSLGVKNIDSIKMAEILADIKNVSFEHRYIELLWLLSIGIMLEIEDNDFNQFVELIKKYNPEDYLIDFILNSRVDWNQKSSKFKFDNPYKNLEEVIMLAEDDKQKAVERLKQYLDKEWYKGHSDSGWYEGHKSEHNTYSGYWCWESGALVKILGLDDTILKGQQYYPYDMVHWQD